MANEQFAHEIIRASAGSGKTYKLSGRYLKLLLDGVTPESILATTFTQKAAGEIQSRILNRLGKGAISDEGARELSKQLMDDPNAIPRERFQTLLVQVVRSINRLRICTLDAFFMQLAGGYAFELGLPPGWTIVEEDKKKTNLGKAIQSTLAQTDGNHAHELSKLLFKGKVKRSIESQVFGLTNAALEIYNESTKAAWLALKELAKPVEGNLDKEIETLPNLPFPDTRIEGPRKQLCDALKEKKWETALDNGLLKTVLNKTYSYYRKPIEGDLKKFLESICEYVVNAQLQERGNQLEAIWNVVHAIAYYFDEIKSTTGEYRFEDISQKLASFLNASDDSLQQEQINRFDYRLDAKTRCLLLDEFQDASYKQWQIIRPFAERITSSLKTNLEPNDPEHAAKLASFFCVGDMKQAIYMWRGGVAEIFQAIEENLKNIHLDKLDKNWRSCPIIINVVNKLFKDIDKNPLLEELKSGKKEPAPLDKITSVQKAFEKWKKQFETHEFSENNAEKDGFWALEFAPRATEDAKEESLLSLAQSAIIDPKGKELEPADESFNVEPEIDCLESDDDDDDDASESNSSQKSKSTQLQKELTISYAARRIRNLRDKYPRASIGVLARNNKFIARLYRKLKRLGVDASVEGGSTLVDAPAVGAMLAVFRLAAHPTDSVDAFCIANIKPLAQEFDLDPNSLDHSTCSRLSSYLRACIETEGYGAYAAKLREILSPICHGDDDMAVRQRERLDQLVKLAYSYQATSPKSSIDDFVKAIAEYKVKAPSANPVRLMTIHASKGLEFDIVVLPELDPSGNSKGLASIHSNKFIVGRKNPLAPIEAVLTYMGDKERPILPEDFQKYYADLIEKTVVEQLCLLYVAITRPKRMLLAIVNPTKVNPTKEKKSNSVPKLSFANVLRYGLVSELPDLSDNEEICNKPQRIYSEGAADWGKDLMEPVETETNDKINLPSDYPSFRKVDRNRLLYRRQTPTGDDVDAAASYQFWKPREVFVSGKSLHACYEQVEWFDLGTPTDLELQNVVAPIVEFDKKLAAQQVAKFRTLCSTRFTQLLMSRESYLEPSEERQLFFSDAACAVADARTRCANPNFVVYRERNFNVTLKSNLILNGTFDRLVLLYDGERLVGADVVDFKTDVNPPSDELFEEYLKQLRCYGVAVEKLFNLPPEKISLRLAFVTLGRVVDARVDVKPDFNATPQY